MEQPSTVQKAAKSTNLTAVITAVIAILLFALMVATSIKPLYNHFAGPFDVTAEELISYQGPGDTFLTSVTTHPNVALDTNFYYFEKQEDGSEKIIHSYYALLFEDRLLLAKYPGPGKGDNIQPGPVTGKIVKLTDEENTQVLQALTEEFPNLKDAFLPYLLDTTGNDEFVWLSIIGIAFLAVFAIFSLVHLIGRSGDNFQADAPQVPTNMDSLVENDYPEPSPDQAHEQEQTTDTSA